MTLQKEELFGETNNFEIVRGILPRIFFAIFLVGFQEKGRFDPPFLNYIEYLSISFNSSSVNAVFSIAFILSRI